MSDDRLARMERQQQAIIQAVSTLSDTIKINNSLLAKLMDWLKEPPSSDVADLLKAIVAKLDAIHGDVLDALGEPQS